MGERHARFTAPGWLVAGAAPIVILAAAVAIGGLLFFAPRGQAVELGALLLAAGIAFAVALRQAPLAPITPLPRWAEYGGLALVVLVALFFRINQLVVAPEGVWFDEAQNGLVAQRILDDPTYRPVFVADLTQLPALMFYLQALSIWLFGPNILALRLVSTVLGLAAVVGVYALGRLLYGAPVAIVAGLLLAVERWHVNFSRFAMSAILVPALTLGAVYFAMRGLRSGRWRDLAIAGALLGLGAYSYPAFYVVPLVVGLPLLVACAAGPRRFIKQQWRGLAALVVVALVVAAPLIRFSLQEAGAATQRMSTASILTGKTPEEAREALLENVRRHLLMFHVRGDPNGRHNLPGAPMLDPVTGALFALGLVFAVSRARRPEYALLVGWLLLALLPPVLSLDFEAPQAYRGIGVTPVAALLAALGAGWLFSRAWEGRRRWTVGLAALPALALGGAVVLNYDTYFNKQLSDFAAWAAYSTPETLMARTILTLPPETRVYVSEFSTGQPTMRFLVGDRRGMLPFDAQKHLPVRDDQPTVLLLNPDLDRQRDRIRELYPDALVTERTGPSGGPSILTVVNLSRDQIVALQGVQAAYYPGRLSEPPGEPAVSRQEQRLEVAWEGGAPLAAPFTAVWRGTLIAPAYGKYRFKLEGPADSVLTLDEAEIVRAGPNGAEVTLPQGNHSLKLLAAFATVEPVRLHWLPPGERAWQPVPPDALFVEPVTSAGLLGNYFPNKDWRGQPTLARIDPTIHFRFHNTPLPRPWSVEWTGRILIPTAGVYRFATQSIDHSWLYIDDQLVVDNSKVKDKLEEAPITLTAGLHAIRVRFVDQTNFTHIEVYWQPPGGGREIIPSRRLTPTLIGEPRMLPPPVTAAAAPTAPAAPAASAAGNAKRISPTVTAIATAERLASGSPPEPRGAAVDAAGNVYVVDTANRVVHKLDPSGATLLTLGPGEGEAAFAEPVAAAIDAATGDLVVLDSRLGWLHRFDASGKPLGRVAGPQARFFQPRGFDIAPDGAIYLADTGGARVLRLNAQGDVEGQIGEKGQGAGQILEPTDVAVDGQGNIFVADVANRKVVAFGADGTMRAEWAIPEANSVVGPHLAPDGRGGVYVSDPATGVVRAYGPSGDLLAETGPLEADGLAAPRPLGVELAAPGVLIVTDVESRRVLRLQLP
jgi:DNA-binding beta-propeller fold protein YncE/4-amino-4-deoxy-L-arabinose transferase-like glycosyltransferase